MLGVYIFTIDILPFCIDLLIIMTWLSWSLITIAISNCILSDMKVAFQLSSISICVELCLLRPLTFSLYVSVGLKWVSFRQYIYGFCFCIFSASLSQLVRAFNFFTFEVIINIQVSTAIVELVLVCRSFILSCASFFFCFQPRKVPLAFVIKLVWWCWILLTLVCL